MEFPREVVIRDSGPITRVAYSPQERRLRVFFASTTTTWDYLEVPIAIFGRLVSAFSVGRAFNELIRDRYPAVKVALEEVAVKTVPPTRGPRGRTTTTWS